ncbi:ATP-binding protein [Christensenellaceae bacterium OttesenSCG-928-K19]|nr:ATP-binding protein [Christensenellaceae bacterium OttesenSCG-928-K19]
MILKKTQINYKKMNNTVDTLVAAVRERIPLDEEKEYRIRLVCKELLTNILSYSDAEDIMLSAALEKGKLTITIKDDGSGFQYTHVLERDCRDNGEMMKESGRGIFLVRMMSEDISFNEKGNAVKVTLDLN